MPLLQAELIARLQAALAPGTTNIGVLVLLNDLRSSFAFTSANVVAGTGTFTVAGHNFLDAGSGTRIQLPTAAPTGLSLNTDYWVRNVSGSTFKLSATPGGSAIASFADAGTGTMTVSDQPLTATDQSLAAPSANNAQWLRKEVGARVSLNTPAAASYTIDLSTGTIRARAPLTALIDNTAGGSTLAFAKGLMLTGGTTTTGNATGTPTRWWDLAGGSVAAGASVTYVLTAFDSN